MSTAMLRINDPNILAIEIDVSSSVTPMGSISKAGKKRKPIPNIASAIR
jgi:LDH2 family malate/lactate/ureidoglycolate dehydrogenase